MYLFAYFYVQYNMIINPRIPHQKKGGTRLNIFVRICTVNIISEKWIVHFTLFAVMFSGLQHFQLRTVGDNPSAFNPVTTNNMDNSLGIQEHATTYQYVMLSAIRNRTQRWTKVSP